MAFIDLHFHPAKLGISTSVSLYIPENRTAADARGGKYPVLWMLHGGGGNHHAFLFGSLITSYAEQYGIALIMPDGQNSSWVDMTYGPKWETYLTDSLREFVFANFPISDAVEDNFIAGVSMGGYGAIHTALHHPELYAKACGMGSGVWLPMKYASGLTAKSELTTLDQSLEASFGPRQTVVGSQYDCVALAQKAVTNGTKLPAMLSCCGTKDFSYQENVSFRDTLDQLGVKMKWLETDAGHEDKAWNTFMPQMFAWLMEE